METIVRNISDLSETDLSAAEQLIGHALTADQRLVIVVQDQHGKIAVSDASSPVSKLPDWCNVYTGLSDSDIADIEAVMLGRAELSRDAE